MDHKFHRISKTAWAIAKIRADFTNIPFSKNMWAELSKIHKKNSIINSLQKIAYKVPPLKKRFCGQEIRYQSTNYALKKENFSQILELATGFSTRGLTSASKYEFYLETDLPKIINLKEKLSKNIKNEPKLIFSSLNPLNYNELCKVGNKFFKNSKNKKVAIIQEGLITYFNQKEQEKIRNNISAFLKEYCPKGAWITPDFSYRKKGGLFGFILKIIEIILKRKYNFFENHSKIQIFLEKGGLKGTVLDNSSILKNLSCLKKMNIKIRSIKLIAKDYRPWIISLNKPLKTTTNS